MGKKIDRPYVDSARGSGRTTKALTRAWELSQDPKEACMVLFVVGLAKLDHYHIRLLARIAGEDNLKQVRLASREVVFKNGGRIRFVNWDNDHLERWAASKWRLRGYRPDLPVVWDHFAEDQWAIREKRRFDEHVREEKAKAAKQNPLKEVRWSCCANERRTMDGGCANCGDPSL